MLSIHMDSKEQKISNKSWDESNDEGLMVNSLSWPWEGGILLGWRWFK